MGDLVVAMVVSTWTRWVDLKVAARSRSGSLTGWFNLGVGCPHDGQINLGMGCSWWSDWLRGGSFTGSRTQGGLIYFPVALALFVLHCKCSPLSLSLSLSVRVEEENRCKWFEGKLKM